MGNSYIRAASLRPACGLCADGTIRSFGPVDECLISWTPAAMGGLPSASRWTYVFGGYQPRFCGVDQPYVAFRRVTMNMVGKSAAKGDGGRDAAHPAPRHVGDEYGGDATHDRGQVRLPTARPLAQIAGFQPFSWHLGAGLRGMTGPHCSCCQD